MTATNTYAPFAILNSLPRPRQWLAAPDRYRQLAQENKENQCLHDDDSPPREGCSSRASSACVHLADCSTLDGVETRARPCGRDHCNNRDWLERQGEFDVLKRFNFALPLLAALL